MKRTIGRWELREKLGQGAMGVVWSAWDASLGRLCAIKLLKPGADEVAQERLRREGQALGRVRHPNVVTVHEVGVHEKIPFVVMELVQGKPLSDLIQARAPREELLVALEQAARGLAAVHEAGIVHRDVKPGNILVDAERARIADFGIVRLDDSSRLLTASTALVGTPLYMAPELAIADRGRLGPAADVFSLGVVLFEILVGEPPLADAPSILGILGALSENEPFPRPSTRDPSARPWDELCAAALEKDPARRLPTATAFADELAAVRRGDARVRSPHGRAALVLGVAAILAGVASSAFALRTSPPAAPPSPLPEEKKPEEKKPDVPREPPRAPVEPLWFRELEHRPAKLPPGVVFGKERGEYVNEKDGTVLVWVPGEKPFFVGKLEVTIEQFARYVFATGSVHHFEPYIFATGAQDLVRELTACWAAPHGRGIRSSPRDPVAQVSWHDARAYARWAGLRLPRVSEWKRAAYVDPRSGEARAFPWGNEQGDDALSNERDRTFELQILHHPESQAKDDGFARAAPVGSLPRGASPVGALDMHGNVVEICEADDAAGGAYDEVTHSFGSSPSAPMICFRNAERLIRTIGSSWSMRRLRGPAVEQLDGCGASREDLGFRLARDP